MKTILSTFILTLFLCTNLYAKDGLLFNMKIRQAENYSCILLKSSYTCIYEIDDVAQSYIEIWSNNREELDNVRIGYHQGTMEIGSKHNKTFNFKSCQVVIKMKGKADMLRKIGVAGSGKIIIRGNICPTSFDIDLTGSGDVAVDSLKTNGHLNLNMVGSGDINIKQAVAREIQCVLAGSGDIDIANIKSIQVEATLRGSGDIKLSGITNKSNYTLKGSGDISASNLKATEAHAELYGSGDIDCNAEKIFSQKRGAGDISTNKTAIIIKQ